MAQKQTLTWSVGISHLFNDPENDPLTISLEDSPQFLTHSTDNGEINFTAVTDADAQTQDYTVKITAKDSFSTRTAEQTFTLSVVRNPAPTAIAIDDLEIYEGHTDTHSYKFSDIFQDDDDLVYSHQSTIGFATYSMDETTATLSASYSPQKGDANTYEFTLFGADIYNDPTIATAKIIVKTNTPPTNSAFPPSFEVTEGESFTQALMAFTDAEGDQLTYALTLQDDSALPSWLSFNEATRILTGTISSPDIDVVNLKLIVSDGINDAVSTPFLLEVNNLPIYTGSEPFQLIVEVDKLETLILNNLFQDPEGMTIRFTVTFSIGDLPTWVELTESNGQQRIEFQASASHIGEYSFNIVATATTGEFFTKSLIVKISEACYEGCKTCSDPDAGSCLTCNEGYMFADNQCYEECPIGYYPELTLQVCKGKKYT